MTTKSPAKGLMWRTKWQKTQQPGYEQGQDNTFTGTKGDDIISGISTDDKLVGTGR